MTRKNVASARPCNARGGVRKLRRPLTAARLSDALGVAEDLRRLRAHLTVWIEQSEREIREPLRWQLVSSAKYFRPLTIFACCRAVSRDIIPTTVMRSAVALEMFQRFSDRGRYPG